MTHSDLCTIGYHWLLGAGRCWFAIAEPNMPMIGGWNENPDAFGVGVNGRTILIEAKASRSDFLADRRKTFRRYPEWGIGADRYYLAPAGMLRREDLPQRWGLIEVNADGKARRKIRAGGHLCRNMRAEVALLGSILARQRHAGALVLVDGRQPTFVEAVAS